MRNFSFWQAHFEHFNLEPQFGTHAKISALSGGQKVKVVLAAAMWMEPHVLILDEPTNFLDRDSLGALATAIKKFGGGCIIISHQASRCNGRVTAVPSSTPSSATIAPQSARLVITPRLHASITRQVGRRALHSARARPRVPSLG